MEKVIILYSGGLDSTILLKGALAMGMASYCAFIDYEQLHIEELKFAQKMCAREGVKLQVVKLRGMEITSKLTSTEMEKLPDPAMSEWYVPARNLIFVGIVSSIAESRGIHKIWYGANGEDRIDMFPDCTHEWVHQMNELLKINSNFKVELSAPLIGIRKPELELISQFLKINKEQIFSGYGNLEKK